MKNKKILMYSLIVFILAGIIVVLLKGFNIDLMLRSHESIEYVIGKEFELKDIHQIAKEVLQDKNIKIRTIEVFDDAVSINSLEITEEEKNSIVNKLNEKYGNDKDTNEVKIISNPGLRLRQILKPYIIPTLISIVLIYVVYWIRFYKYLLFDWKKIIESLIIVMLFDLSILSLVAIIRIPVTTILIPVIIFITVFSIILYFEKEKNSITKKLKSKDKEKK